MKNLINRYLSPGDGGGDDDDANTDLQIEEENKNKLDLELLGDEKEIRQDDITKAIIDGEPLKKKDEGQESVVEKSAREEKERLAAGGDDLDKLPFGWKQLAKSLGTKEEPYKVPKAILEGKKEDGTPLTEEDKFEMLREEIYNNTDLPWENDPIMNSYMTAKQDEKFDPFQWISEQAKEFEVLKLEPKEYMFKAYKQYSDDNKRSWTDEEINEEIGKKTKIQLETEVNDMKQKYYNGLAEKYRGNTEKMKVKQEADFEKAEATNEVIVKDYIKGIEKLNNIGGLEFSESERTKFISDLPAMIKRNKETGVNMIEELLQSDENFLKLAPVLWMALKGNIAKYTTNIKESTKKKMIENLDLEPKIKGTSFKNDPNDKRLYEPDIQ